MPQFHRIDEFAMTADATIDARDRTRMSSVGFDIQSSGGGGGGTGGNEIVGHVEGTRAAYRNVGHTLYRGIGAKDLLKCQP